MPTESSSAGATPPPPDPQVAHSLTCAPVPLVWGLYGRYGLIPAGGREALRWTKILLSSFAGVPFRWREYLSRVRRQALATPIAPPLFVIGHWRSGTTLLHNLLTKDPQFGCLTLSHCILTDAFLTAPNWLRRIMAQNLPEERVVDRVPLGADVPQEEEFATERMTPLSYNHCYLFPDKAEAIFRRSVLFETGDRDRLRWEAIYDNILRRLSFEQGGKPLCLKNPPNTARIRSLLNLYPEAKFVHIIRDPEQVFRSTRKLWKTVTDLLGLRRATREQMDQNFVLFYELTMRRFLEDRPRLSPTQLVEVRFEDLEQRPLETLRNIYDQLQIDGFAAAEPQFQTHLTGIGGYQKNQHTLRPEDARLLNDRWGFAFDAWGYDRPKC